PTDRLSDGAFRPGRARQVVRYRVPGQMGPALPGAELRGHCGMSRYTPITSKETMAPDQQHVFDQVMGVFGRIRGPFSMLLHSPKLAEKLLPMVPFAREGTVIDPKLRQIAILTAVRERDANYVWAAQVDVGRRVGLREPVIDILRAKRDPADLQPEERDIVL